jgi:hypothetical protein
MHPAAYPIVVFLCEHCGDVLYMGCKRELRQRRDDLILNGVYVDVERKLTNQDAFDISVLHLLNQGHCCFNASGKSKYRGSRGKSAVGALIPDHLYVISMEGKTIQQLLAGSNYASLRERLGGVTTTLLSELQDLHDRVGECLPSLFRHLVLAGCYRIAQAFGLSPRLAHLWVAYQRIPGSRVMQTLDRPSEALKLVA